jgi:hypothetical protein
MTNPWPRPNKPPDPDPPVGSNYYTPEQANLLICPIRNILHMEIPPQSGYPGSTGYNQTHPCCSAAACMWWRWAKSPPAPAGSGFCGGAGTPP